MDPGKDITTASDNFKIAKSCFNEHIELVLGLNKHFYIDQTILMAERLIETLNAGGTLFWCGNGGSAADSSHFSAELVGRFNKPRDALRSTCLSVDPGAMTCIANDFDYAEVFSRQLDAQGRPGDLLIMLSTSGESENQIKAAMTAAEIGISTMALLGKGGGRLAKLADEKIVVPSETTARIQEAHTLICHTVCTIIDEYYFGRKT